MPPLPALNIADLKEGDYLKHVKDRNLRFLIRKDALGLFMLIETTTASGFNKVYLSDINVDGFYKP